MCQLLGMNCNIPTDICFSFTGFQARGGGTDVHKDGWGIAFFEGRGVRQFLDSQASIHSPIAELVRNYPIKSKNVISHIRKATQGLISLENTHPFARELWGYYWIFAHNGNITGFKPELDGNFRPVGQTDSEFVFCWMLQELQREFKDQPPSQTKLFDFIRDLTLQAGSKGEFNFLLSNGEMLLAHGSTKLSYIIRQAPFQQARLKDQEVTVDFSALTTERDRVAVIATVPLTDNESWEIVEPGTLLLFNDGSVARSAKTIAGVKTVCEPTAGV
jgi:predicted glutamine amidotransferase